jgi:CRISPR system Cascade subunit CasA
MFAPGAGWLGKLGLITLSGDDLFQTLLLNFVLLDDSNAAFKGSEPVWELADVKDAERTKIAPPGGLAELYTLQSRRLLLKFDGDAAVGYYLLGGDAFDKENAFIEQMTLWRKKDKDFVPRRHSPGKQLWRDFGALIQGGNDNRKPGVVEWSERLAGKNIVQTYNFSAVGVQFGDKDFFVDDLYSDSLTVNSSLFSELNANWQGRIVEELGNTEDAVKAFGVFASDLAIAEGLDIGERGKNLQPVRESAREKAYFALDPQFREWLRNIDAGGSANEAMNEWQEKAKRTIKRLADDMLEEVSDAAIIGHKGKNAFEAKKWFNINLSKAFKGGKE